MANIHPLEYFICGGFGGICAVFIGHPLDTIKVRLQTMPKPAAGEKPIYTGTWDCIMKTVKTEGIKGLYKGMGAPLLSGAPIFSISFFAYGVGKELFGPKDGTKLNGFQYFCAGAFSALFTTSIMAPGERIKCLLQIQESSGKKIYNGPLDCAIKLYKQGGIRTIYLGSFATMLRDVPSGGAYFSTYETLKNIATENGRKEMNVLETMAAGGLAGIAFWVVGMPADVLKSRLQTAPEGTYKNGIRDVFSTLIKTDGVLALYTGFIPVLLRSFPANAACFLGFEICTRFLNIIESWS